MGGFICPSGWELFQLFITVVILARFNTTAVLMFRWTY